MDILTAEQVRVLGCLLEKAVTTPDHYPLTLNALLSACNQKSSRDPVVAYAEEDVVYALDALRDGHFVWQATTPGSRVPKYKHDLRAVVPLSDAEEALLCCLMLRGPQTVGELRTRTNRLYDFASLEAVAATLAALADRDEPLVRELPRQPGRKDCRWTHLLAGEPEIAEADATAPMEPARARVAATDQRLQELTDEVAELTSQLAELRAEFAAFKSQFD